MLVGGKEKKKTTTKRERTEKKGTSTYLLTVGQSSDNEMVCPFFLAAAKHASKSSTEVMGKGREDDVSLLGNLTGLCVCVGMTMQQSLSSSS